MQSPYTVDTTTTTTPPTPRTNKELLSRSEERSCPSGPPHLRCHWKPWVVGPLGYPSPGTPPFRFGFRREALWLGFCKSLVDWLILRRSIRSPGWLTLYAHASLWHLRFQGCGGLGTNGVVQPGKWNVFNFILFLYLRIIIVWHTAEILKLYQEWEWELLGGFEPTTLLSRIDF